nr:MAG TPA: hypothetical protein [Caudoviricetes sp.]
MFGEYAIMRHNKQETGYRLAFRERITNKERERV